MFYKLYTLSFCQEKNKSWGQSVGMLTSKTQLAYTFFGGDVCSTVSTLKMSVILVVFVAPLFFDRLIRTTFTVSFRCFQTMFKTQTRKVICYSVLVDMLLQYCADIRDIYSVLAGGCFMGITHLSIPGKVCLGVLERRVLSYIWILDSGAVWFSSWNSQPALSHSAAPWKERKSLPNWQFIFLLSLADERDRVQKKTFTKWVNKHLVKVRTFCEYTLANTRLQ